MMLTWPLAATGYYLESATALGSDHLWISNAAASAITNGCIAVAQPLSGDSRFFRLRRP
jgi:hypothetical protein